MEYLRKEYGDLLLQTPETGQSVTLAIDLDKLPENHAALARKCALLKRNCMASLFTKFFDLHANAGPTTPGIRAVIHYRSDETLYVQALHDRVTVIFSTMFKDPDDMLIGKVFMQVLFVVISYFCLIPALFPIPLFFLRSGRYVQALHDRVTVIFSTMFKDPDDMLIGKVFMQEFTEARRRLDRAPQVLYSHRVPPAELQGTNAVVSDSVAYITFVLFPRHISSEASRQKSIDLIHTLRNYLHYHIKCSKAYIQMRMRAKTSEFLKVINRASVETSGAPVVNVAPTGEVSPLFAASLASKSAAAEATSGSRSMTVG
ncbi:hypothetical protein T265_09441 [Opisthorchis viverrini]|uniref:Arp2/3 complex 34 kDa subunit n=1 Tax=Opisthorchis viverrini TaxID=6198 RepID=A0A074ZA47_OPIVI|nr:hypothetical protein T265_09441 [Opisthorchis viverrini]KER22462.1 hypothetical protein T265_09441 [Opisthorchis viverrini]